MLRTAFVTNLPLKVTEADLQLLFAACGTVRKVIMSKHKATGKFLGYAHVQFETTAAVSMAILKCDKVDLHGRMVRVTRSRKGERFRFQLPEKLKEEVRALMREAYEGKNLSTIKDAWQKRHESEKLNTATWGFKNFSSAVATIEGVRVETHAEKSLTQVAFFEGSPLHVAFLERKRLVQEQAEKEKAEKVAAAAAAAATADGASSAEAVGGGGSVVAVALPVGSAPGEVSAAAEGTAGTPKPPAEAAAPSSQAS